jgi:hypothetical protein
MVDEESVLGSLRPGLARRYDMGTVEVVEEVLKTQQSPNPFDVTFQILP